jgi:hypothetical protein
MSATNSTATTGQTSQVGPLAAAAALAAILAFGALGLAVSRGVSTTAINQPAAGLDGTSMSGPRSAAQKGLGANQAAIAATKDADASVAALGANRAGAYSGSDFAGQYKQWLAIQKAGNYSGSEFERQYSHWAAAQKANGASSAPAGASGFGSGRISPIVRQPQ